MALWISGTDIEYGPRFYNYGNILQKKKLVIDIGDSKDEY